MIVTITLAVGAAAVFAAGTSLQHRAASDVPHEGLSTLGFLPRLLRKPGWLLGLLLSGIAFILHVAALRHGALTLVQPVVVSTIVFAVFVRAGLDRRLPDRKEIAWAICTWAGLSLFISVLEARPAHHRVDPRSEAIFVLSGVLAAVLAVVWARRTHTATRRGMLLGVAAGLLFGLTAGLIKVVITQTAFGLHAVLHHWSLLALLVTGSNALLLSQRAYQAARLSVIMPILNIVDVLVAIGFGAIVFGERLFSSPVHLAAEIVGLVVMALGVRQLAQHEEGSPISHYYPPPADVV